MLARAALYLRTLRMLRPVQVAYLPLRRVQRGARARPSVLAAPPACALTGPLSRALSDWGAEPIGERLATAERVAAGRFRFLNHEERIESVDWTRRYVSHLWSYNLHSFDYAVDLAWMHRLTGGDRYLHRLVTLARGWIEGTGSGNSDGWEPYALSLRVVNWIYALLLVGDELSAGDRELLHASLGAQVRYLECRLEFHLLANHLQKNYLALAVAGLYFEGADAARWLQTGVQGLWRELEEQVLADGTHFERSPMYHALALGDYLAIIGLLDAAGQTVPEAARRRVGRMLTALMVLARPDGTLHLFNDAAHGIAPSRDRLAALARRVLGHDASTPRGPAALPDGGYFGWIGGEDGDHCLIDCGEPGPSYQPGHAHCDVLSFELDLAGVPVIVDSGVSGYDGDPMREYVRSTRAHNTVSIAGREQSELWGTFRAARRAQARSATIAGSGEAFAFDGACSPYYDRSIVHRRRVIRRNGRWTVSDEVAGAEGATVLTYLHLHPEFDLRAMEDGRLVVASSRATATIETFGIERIEVRRGALAPVQGWYCPEFGVRLPAVALEMYVAAGSGRPFGYHISLR